MLHTSQALVICRQHEFEFGLCNFLPVIIVCPLQEHFFPFISAVTQAQTT